MDKELVISAEHKDHMCQWVFAASPGSPVLKNVIDMVIQKIRLGLHLEKHFVLNTTGPGIFTVGIFDYLRKNPHVIQDEKKPSDPLGLHALNIDTIHVFDHKTFHSHHVKHLFYGCRNGWMQRRNNIIKKHRSRGGFGLSVFS
jgi:hypothetical protein